MPTGPQELLGTPLGQSGLSGATVLRRAGMKLGFSTVRELLFHLPRRYDDLRRMYTLRELRSVEEGTVVSAQVRVAGIRVQQTWKRRVQVTTASLVDDSGGDAEATWFGRRYIEKRVRAGDELIVSGKVKRRGFAVILDDPDFQKADAVDLLHVGRIVPVYRLTQGLTANRLRVAMREALDRAGKAYREYLPPRIRDAEDVEAIGQALEHAHYPEDDGDADRALRRLALDELLALQLGMVQRRKARARTPARAVELDDELDVRIRGAVEAGLRVKVGRDVRLTDDQSDAIAAIRADIARATPMLRLIQGDVGSGKTAVAAWALAAAALTGRQGALLAPTDLLARQHAATISTLVDGLGIAVELLTGSLTAERRRTANDAIANGMAGIVVGTHALLQEAVSFADLALAVVDEQHRFGVEQRGALEAKAAGSPHVLLMTATPIPRTLGQVIYADLEVSTLRTAPAGRPVIQTGIKRPDELDGTWERVEREADAGHRTFVVVPRIGPAAGEGDGEDAAADFADEDVEAAWAVAAEAEAVRLRERFPNLTVGLVHGRMKAADRDAEMARFRDGGVQVLVGTTVVEVGVDVPEATMMIVQGADRFGLAQLHQLRGRVGRGTAASFCVLVSAAADGTTELERLKAVKATSDGFVLAEKDFELRREGDVLGLVQSGLPALRVATLAKPEHRELAKRAREHAEALIDDDGRIRDGHGDLEAELHAGWLARVYAGDPSAAASAA